MTTARNFSKCVLLLVGIFAIIFLLPVFGALNAFCSTAYADTTPEEQFVWLDYLQRIPNTPFAEKKSLLIKVPVYEDNEIRLDDVKKELKCKSFGVMQSYGDTFEYNATTDRYTAVYYKSVYLNAKTVDGNSKNFYLDCNLSFEQYFKPFVANGTLEQSIYEFYLNKIHVMYPELDGYTPDNIYGYFGLIPIPNGRNLNQLWKDLFGTATTFSGVLESFMYTNVLTNAGYKKLLEEYNYSWLEVIWKGFVDQLLAGSVNADFYMVYVDSQTTEAFIAENAADDIDDNSSVIVNGVENGIDSIGSWFDEEGGWIKAFAIILATVLILVLLAYLATLASKNKKDKGDKK